MSVAAADLSFSYDGLRVLHGISVETRPGRITAVLGPNAAGKSTLLRCAIGALRPAGGAVLVDGIQAHRLRGRDLATRIAYVPQRASVAAAFTVREVVELGRYALPRTPARVDGALARLDLAALARRPYPALSVGQQQRVTLARAVAQLEPAGNLILDEPTAAMDLRRARACFGLLREVADRGATILVAMHDLSAAAAVADDVWLVADGRLVAAGAADDVLRVERLEEIFGVGFEWLARRSGRRVLVAETGPGARPDDASDTIAPS